MQFGVIFCGVNCSAFTRRFTNHACPTNHPTRVDVDHDVHFVIDHLELMENFATHFASLTTNICCRLAGSIQRRFSALVIPRPFRMHLGRSGLTMRRSFRCRICKQILGDLYDDELEKPLPVCPKGHKTELVPLTTKAELKRQIAELNLEPSARQSQVDESKHDPLTYRQRMKKGQGAS
jgi:hypothetical protein